ncbi:MAG: ribbon-helix-helix domain-containing protein, partial [Rhodospirillales bacterium]
RRGMSGRPVKRSLTLRGHRTSVSLEDVFWDEFRRIAEARGLAWDDEAATALIRPEAFDRHCAPAGDSTDALA